MENILIINQGFVKAILHVSRRRDGMAQDIIILSKFDIGIGDKKYMLQIHIVRLSYDESTIDI